MTEREEELKAVEACFTAGTPDKEIAGLLHVVHKTIRKVTEDVERFHLNTAISATMELVNAVHRFAEAGRTDREAAGVLRGAVETLIVLVSPFCPHIAQELWEKCGHGDLRVAHPWPSYEESYVTEETVTFAIQVNGKLRDTVELERDMEEGALKSLVLSLEKVQRHLEGRSIRKVIIVPNKLVNIVA